MCLTINGNLTKKGLKGRKVHSNGMVKVWKCLFYTREGFLISPFYSDWGCSHWKPGWKMSNRQSKKMTLEEKHYQRIYYGIHVYLNRKSARRAKASAEVVVPVYVYKKDLIAIGYVDEAVFNQVFFKKEDYNKALKK